MENISTKEISEGLGSLNPAVRQKMVQNLATLIGKFLRQSYKIHNGTWWIFTNEKPVRAMEKEEIEWHEKRNHFPFVKNGITQDDPRWWNEPKNI